MELGTESILGMQQGGSVGRNQGGEEGALQTGSVEDRKGWSSGGRSFGLRK